MNSEQPTAEAPGQPSLPSKGGILRRFLRAALIVGFPLLVLGLLLAGFARLTSFDWGVLELPLLYPPYLLLVVLALIAAVYFTRKRQKLWLGLSLIAGLLPILSLGWSESAQQPQATDFVVLALNTHDRWDHSEELARFCATESVDILLLQEIKPEHREPFLKALPDYHFVWSDREHFKGYREHDSSLTGIKKDLLGGTEVSVEAGITGYRTFAVQARLRERPVWLVNVHCSRPAFFDPRRPRDFFFQFPAHRQEGDLLEAWLAHHGDLPILVAGDFNAPQNARNVRLSEMTQAHAVAGSGPHLTFPTFLPVVGIDHMLGNRHIAFHSYRTFATSISDHKAQLSHFSLR